MISQLADLSLAYFILSIRHQLIGILKSKQPWRRQRMGPNLLPPKPVLSRSSTCEQCCITLVFQCVTRVTCLEITSRLSIALQQFMLNFTNDTPYCHSIVSVKQLRQVWLISPSSMAVSTQLISSANIGDILKFGNSWNLCFIGMEIHLTLVMKMIKYHF